ncbi:hypothetical protein G6011_02429 [Alternaria panax]|uniref:Uncharacterized protein n=1 Tax=Alternaria panax TaxID=48097 RepID=A0AAD4FGZ1_9PLEO|nr:hypothetical protein G6011_02429 [Alternaria panax]
MANEEQRRAFESYMGRTGGSGSGSGSNGQGQSQGQPIPQYPDSFAQPSNSYLFKACTAGLSAWVSRMNCQLIDSSLHHLQQFPGLGVPPAAPTPPPAASSSVASFPGYQGGYQGGFPQAGYGQGTFDQTGIPQRPPPLLDPQAQQRGQQQMPTAGPPGYAQAQRSYNTQPPPPPGYSADWQYNSPESEMGRRRMAPLTSAMVPSSRNTQQDVMESRSRQTSEQYHYQQYGQSQTAAVPPSQGEEVAVPVMLCHTCSHCSQMRSAGFHRNNPVLPGKPMVPSLCRRCKKKLKSSRRSSSRYTHVRKCTADVPCNWPGECVHMDIGQDEYRGRRQSREEVYVTRYSPSRPRVIRRESSQARLGLRVLQQPREEPRHERKIETSSLSPRRPSRYAGEVWPPPDIVSMRETRSDEVYFAAPAPLHRRTSRSDAVWPPPDIVRTHSYRKVERSPPRRAISRIVELSPSPPPHTRSTRVVYRNESQERRPRSQGRSPIRVSFRAERGSEEAEARLMLHPRPYRPIVPEQRSFVRASDETSSNADSVPHRRLESPSRSILKPVGTDSETAYRRKDTMRESQQSMHVEVGGSRVHFGEGRRQEEPVPELRGRSRYADEPTASGGNDENYREYSRQRVANKPLPQPPTQNFERMRIHHSSPSPRREYEEDIRIDRQRRLSPSPPPFRRFEEIRVRHTSPLTARRTPRLPDSPPSPERPPRPLYRHVSHIRAFERARTVTPPPSRRRQEEDHTDSESAHSGEITEVRSWKGIDENGQPATFVEERRTVRMIDQGSDRGGLAKEYRDRGRGGRLDAKEKVTSRNWTDV